MEVELSIIFWGALAFAAVAAVVAGIAYRVASLTRQMVQDININLNYVKNQLKSSREELKELEYYIDALCYSSGSDERQLEAQGKFLRDCGSQLRHLHSQALSTVVASINTEDDYVAKSRFLSHCRSLLPEARSDHVLAVTAGLSTQADVEAALTVLRSSVIKSSSHTETEIQAVPRYEGWQNSDDARDYDLIENEVEVGDQERDVSAALSLLQDRQELEARITALKETSREGTA